MSDLTKTAAVVQSELTVKSFALFERFARDASEWSGSPLLDITVEERGNLSDLKKKGLVTTWWDSGFDWVEFTALGLALSAINGFGAEEFTRK